MVLVLVAAVTPSVRAQSAVDGFDPNADGPILVVAIQPDGKSLIGGDFHQLSPNGASIKRNGIARLNPDGTVDLGFNPIANDTVRAIAVQADGKIVIGGDFTTLAPNNTPAVVRNRIARLNPDGTLDTTFNANANGPVRVITLHPAGRLLVGGIFTSIGGAARANLARLTASGAADSFNPSPNGTVNAIAVDQNGILVGGNFFKIAGAIRNNIARLGLAGDLQSFNPGANNSVFALTIQSDHRILVGGIFTTIAGVDRGRIARLDPVTGAADPFRPDANGDVYSIALQGDGKILVGGAFTTIGRGTVTAIARLNQFNGFADGYRPTFNGQVFCIAVQPDGKALAVGDFTTVEGFGRNRIARMEIDGRLDRTLNLLMLGNSVIATAVQTDGKILIGGLFTAIRGVPRNNIARLNTDGSLDTTFNPNANSAVITIAVQPDGKILAGGFFTNIGGASRKLIARLDAETGLADSFNPSASELDTVEALSVLPNGKILVSGTFTSMGGATRRSIARLDSSTGAADSFNANVAGGDIASLLVQPDGKILIGGDFTSVGGQPRRKLARLNADGTLDNVFRPDADFRVQVIALQPDGKVLAGGNFTTIGGTSRNHLARLDGTTGVADSFDPRPDSTVESIAVQSDGKILVSGIFGRVPFGGAIHKGIVRFGPTGALDSFEPNPDDDVRSVCLPADGKVLIGGNFTDLDGVPRHLFARLSNDTAALQDLSVTADSITWTRDGASPVFTRATFESSPDNVHFTFLGDATQVGPDWVLSGLNLPVDENIVIRARGYYRSGQNNGSESAVGSRRSVSLSPGRFVIGDRAAVVGERVMFWGAQWAKANPTSGGRSPTNFKGFVRLPSTVSSPICGETWSSGPRDFGAAPAALPVTIKALVASSVTESGAVISGNIIGIATIQVDPGYDGVTGHAGTGTILSVSCSED
jgi:uncharacterized delta-60 repeat protein